MVPVSAETGHRDNDGNSRNIRLNESTKDRTSNTSQLFLVTSLEESYRVNTNVAMLSLQKSENIKCYLWVLAYVLVTFISDPAPTSYSSQSSRGCLKFLVPCVHMEDPEMNDTAEYTE